MKNIILLPFVAILSACTGTGGSLESNTVVIEERGAEGKTVDAIVRDENFNWSDLTKPFNKATNTTQANAKEQAVAKLKASETNFVLYFSQ